MLSTLAILSFAVIVFGLFDAVIRREESFLSHSVDEKRALTRVINFD